MMARKTQVAYEALVEVMKNEVAPDFHPSHIMCDFEKGLRNALQRGYTDAALHGCFFHFTQAIILLEYFSILTNPVYTSAIN